MMPILDADKIVRAKLERDGLHEGSEAWEMSYSILMQILWVEQFNK